MNLGQWRELQNQDGDLAVRMGLESPGVERDCWIMKPEYFTSGFIPQFCHLGKSPVYLATVSFFAQRVMMLTCSNLRSWTSSVHYEDKSVNRVF